MALDQVKTQVLLLHSEQSTLDNLSQGFDDRYTVHCATSGTEALITLGDTPIHVIISAKDLPGMSGVEALREAKKRSPDTIGILLAGKDEKGLEALVGEKEVFQIVRGGITGDDLGKLIDNATQQMRLMALAESANDTAANPDEPAAEHIVMETSDNGATIISDGTGSMPALDPKRISASVAAGARAVDVLVLTKDEEFLNTVRESTRGLHNVRYANTLAQAEEALAKHKVGVAVVDAAMVGPNVEKLTQHLRKKTDRLVNIVAGRRDDGDMLMDLINRGKVYRFLLKPVSPGRARLAIEASVKHHIEAPDSAFKTVGRPAAKAPPAKTAPAGKTAAKPKVKPKVKTDSKTNLQPKTDPVSQSGRFKSAEVDTSRNVGPFTISPNDDALSSAFDEEESSFAATMTGIVETVGKTFSKDKDSDTPDSAMGISSIEGSAESAGGEGGSPFSNPLVLGVGALALAAIAGAGFWFFGGSEQIQAVDEVPSTVQSTIDEGELVVEETPIAVEAPVQSADELLAEARLARDAGQIFSPPESNALELYAAAAAAEPSNDEVQAEYAAIIDQSLSMAETALLERRPDDASAALDRVVLVDPGNVRLPFLSAQLEQMQLRDALDSARASIRESRFEDASNAIASATALNPADTTELDVVVEELEAARSAQQVDDVLAQANTRLEEGNLITPTNDNARYYYELVLSNDPENTAAQQGLTVVASKLVLQARTEIDRGRFDRAEGLLGEAQRLDPSSAELTAATGALSDARARVAAEQQQQAEARAAAERAEAERIAAEQRAEEERLAAETAAAEAAEGEADGGLDAATDKTAATASAADGSAAAVPLIDQAPIAVSQLTRKRYVAPKYPRSAERRGVSGWVDVVFTVTIDGTTTDIVVRQSEPGDTFVNSAVKAVERWEFEPVFEGDVAIETRAGVRMMFAIE